MNLPELHRRLLLDVLEIGVEFPLVIAGGYAVKAHGLVDRPSRDLDFATTTATDTHDIATLLRKGLEQRGWSVRELQVAPLAVRFMVTEPVTGQTCEVDILKDVFTRPPAATELGLALSLDDIVAAKVRALGGRGVARDFIDVHAAADVWSFTGLETLAEQHVFGEYDLASLRARLAGAEWIDDSEFEAYGLVEGDIAEIRAWAQRWADDIDRRLIRDSEEYTD
ncbi:nucleotidyl transferase AbiEii/AbiGii toxin family protein [Yinghuangia seranimata]|uniref:nucleotidyl transferase AbiEii/AbiGii toxin family protein n=1 Tax=Yinghuangia seranimata TaxID=408067 RepID=UPI00248CDE31|nr:nucleotidyl transferase AbiEii/AbiGii toxin family protein [Yinghuangia seranimata]MDI2127228.1 nucleotidyl transferase AbiEii/AbiGii toxin family protein [Yinghuangia seranimata]